MAYHNVCRHRGAPLRTRPRREVCVPLPRVGVGARRQLLHAPDGGCFRGGIPATHRWLAPVAAAEWAGFVWVHLDSPRQSFGDYLGAVAERVAPFRPDDFALVEHASVEWSCNWKLAVEAFSETYHLTRTHPHLLEIVDPKQSRFDEFGLHNLLSLGLAVVDERYAWERPGELTSSLLARHGIDPGEVTGAPDARARLQRAVRERGGPPWGRLRGPHRR